jgi:poly-gamma-glutamate synthesis protein (capsule biosynthesis protein)
MQPFIHKLIDNGLDMYFGTGNHNMQGIEIYRGRHILQSREQSAGEDLSGRSIRHNPGNLTGTDSRERGDIANHWNDITGVAYVANTTYKDGRLVEIRIYPVDIGLGQRSWSRNVPETPTPEKARVILERIQNLSEPFGTKISIENNIGIIRVPPEATLEVTGTDISGRQPRQLSPPKPENKKD